MEQVIFVREGMWYALEGRVVAQGPTSEVVKAFQSRMSVVPIFLPYGDSGCACFGQNDRRKFFLMYLEPKKRVLQYLNEGSGERKAYSIVLPHSYIALFFRGGAIEQGYGLVAKKRLVSPKDAVGMLPLPNLSVPFGQICVGNRGMWPVTQDASETAGSYLKYFLQSEFTAHINNHFVLLPKELKVAGRDDRDRIGERGDTYKDNEKMFEQWEKLSNVEHAVETISNFDWKTDFTVESMIRDLWQVPEEEI